MSKTISLFSGCKLIIPMIKAVNRKLYSAFYIPLTYLYSLMLSFIAQWTAFFRWKLWHFSYLWSKHRWWGASNKHQQSMFWRKTKTRIWRIPPTNPTFFYIKWSLRGRGGGEGLGWCGCSQHGLVNGIVIRSTTKSRKKHSYTSCTVCYLITNWSMILFHG